MKRVLKPILATSIILAALTAGTFYFLTKGGGSSNAFENRITKEQSDQSAGPGHIVMIWMKIR